LITKELLLTCLEDNRKAHYELYKASFTMMYSVCRRYYKNDEDVKSCLNMVFLKVITNLKSFLEKEREHEAFEYWVKRIAINYIVDELRKNKKYKEAMVHSDDLSFYDAPETTHHDIDFDKQEVLNAIEKLPTVGRTIFTMYAVDGYKLKEIAAMMKITESTSKVHFHKAKIKLKEILGNKYAAAILVMVLLKINN